MRCSAFFAASAPLALSAALLLAGAAWADDAAPAQPGRRPAAAVAVAPMAAASAPALSARAGAVLPVPVNKSEIVRVDRRIGKSLIGNPDIADIVPVTTSSVYVLGKKVGTTSLTLTDERGQVITVLDVAVTPDAETLSRQLADMFPANGVKVRVSGQALTLEGTVADAVMAERMVALARTYAGDADKVVNMLSVAAPQQVLLEVRFAEVTRGVAKQLGINNVNWLSSGSGGSIGAPPDLQNNPFLGTVAIGNPGSIRPDIGIQIDALERQGMARTLAQPNLIALSGQTANFLAGGEFPVPAGVAPAGGGIPFIQIEFKPFGVSLAFTPTVLADGVINLVVAPEVSQLDREASIQLSGFTIPGLRVRRARTSLELRDGQSFAMAGLIRAEFEDTIRAVPLLGRIPIIGALFRSSGFRNNETELVIMVTPRLVRPVKPEQIALPTDTVGRPNDAEFFLRGRLERPVAPPTPAPVPVDGGHILR
jgi:pilus assembly protein CpaC